jgi:hypothetical protein
MRRSDRAIRRVSRSRSLARISGRLDRQRTPSQYARSTLGSGPATNGSGDGVAADVPAKAGRLPPAAGLGDRRLLGVAVLLVVSSVSWRAGSYYSGGVDAVVAAKALLSVGGLMMAFQIARHTPFRRTLGSRTVWLLLAYTTVTMLGAAGAGNVTASGVLAVRLCALAAAVFLLARCFAPIEILRAFVIAMLGLAAVAAGTGAGTLLAGRLSGGIPPLPANELAFLCGASAICIVWRDLHRQAARFDVPVVVVLLAIVWLTGSRTGLLALIAAMLLMLAQLRRWPVPAMLIVAFSVAPLVYAVIGRGMLSKFLERGGAQTVSSLSNRTVAWSAAIHLYDAPWQLAFGSGLSVKKIPVAGQWWNTQILDSSWMSAYVQGGRVGLALLALWAVAAVLSAAATRRPERLLWTGLIAYLLLGSVLESGLLDATPAFCIFFLVCVASERASRLGDVIVVEEQEAAARRGRLIPARA